MFEETIRQIVREEIERAIGHLAQGQSGAGAAGGDQPLMVTIPEAAKLLGIKRSLAYELVKMGRIPTVDLGPRNTRVPVAALRQLGLGGQAAAGRHRQ